MPINATTKLQCFWRDSLVCREFRSAVSLHSHTMYSEESLRALPRYLAQHAGFDLRDGFWTPPLTARQAYRLEQKQMESAFQLPGFVSLTDHDDIRAGAGLRVLDGFRDAPISTEWTMPFGSTFFHLGVHNLPPRDARATTQELADFTSRPEARKLSSALERLTRHPEVLIVLNHPLWDEERIGLSQHLKELRALLDQQGRRIHALEVNGMRSWAENERVFLLGREAGLPVVAGGDRHGLEPNALLNLSRATNFPEFVQEVRVQRFSHVVLMPQYRLSRKLRILHTVIDLLREYPDNWEGRRSWPERVFYRDPATRLPIPLSAFESSAALRLIERCLAALRLLDKRPSSVILTNA